jgi:hypothetical protein
VALKAVHAVGLPTGSPVRAPHAGPTEAEAAAIRKSVEAPSFVDQDLGAGVVAMSRLHFKQGSTP